VLHGGLSVGEGGKVVDDGRQERPPGRLVHPDYAVLRAPRYYVVPFVLPAVGFAVARKSLRCSAE
jgi:hypothetical protein